MQEAEDQPYQVAGVAGYTFTQAARHYKTRYESYEAFHTNVITHPGLGPFGDRMKEAWEHIVPLSVQEALQISNLEQRRAAFTCIGVERLFRELQPERIKAETVTKVNHRWNALNEPYTAVLQDTYELYRIPKEKLFDPGHLTWDTRDAFAVRCWCTTTHREYFMYVPEDIGEKGDPIEAIAWTIWLNVRNPLRIYRQGDIILAEAPRDAQPCSPYHLDRAAYLRLMYTET